MSRITQSINRRLSLLGVQGIIGLGILIACLAFYDAVIHPLQQQLTLQQQLLNEPGVPVRNVPHVDWRSLPEHLPPQAQGDELLGQIYYLAQAANISLSEAEFKEERTDKSHLLIRHLNFIVQGDYFQVRQFLSTSLNEIPVLALESLSFQKSRDNKDMLDVKISMTLYLAR